MQSPTGTGALAGGPLDEDVVIVDTERSSSLDDPRLESVLADRADGEARA
jgi:hypothetical protein